MSNSYINAQGAEIRIAKVVGENEDGLTLFVPKSMDGEFHLMAGDTFLSFLFVKNDGHGGVMTWLPWAEGPVLPS